MNFILSPVKWQYVLANLSDIVVFLQVRSEYIQQVLQVLNQLKNAEVTLNLEKCSFFTNTIDYLGLAIRPRRLEISFLATDAIEAAKRSTTLTKLRSFLGTCNVISRFVPNFARIAVP